MAWSIAEFSDERGDIPARYFLVAIVITILAYLGVVLLLLISAEQAAG
jgi:hypothetical protein